ncbi:hypothetical protein EI067_19110 [Mycobacterium paragordonae]|nr:hypothetical protein EI067_19110 [Mycobacterium paragordonae]
MARRPAPASAAVGLVVGPKVVSWACRRRRRWWGVVAAVTWSYQRWVSVWAVVVAVFWVLG